MPRVFTAEAPRFGAMGSLGDASYMLLRQYQFPDTYDDRDKHLQCDHDRIMSRDRDKAEEVFRRYSGVMSTDYRFEHWVTGQASDQEVMAFLIEVLEADKSVEWTGYRIMGSVHSNGQDVLTLELFAKQPETDTKVYTGLRAPNVLAGRRKAG